MNLRAKPEQRRELGARCALCHGAHDDRSGVYGVQACWLQRVRRDFECCTIDGCNIGVSDEYGNPTVPAFATVTDGLRCTTGAWVHTARRTGREQRPAPELPPRHSPDEPGEAVSPGYRRPPPRGAEYVGLPSRFNPSDFRSWCHASIASSPRHAWRPSRPARRIDGPVTALSAAASGANEQSDTNRFPRWCRSHAESSAQPAVRESWFLVSWSADWPGRLSMAIRCAFARRRPAPRGDVRRTERRFDVRGWGRERLRGELLVRGGRLEADPARRASR